MNKKFKYGGTAVLLTAAVIALVILVNAVFSALSKAYFWYTDMTEFNLYSLTDDSRALLDTVDPEKRFSICFCKPADRILDATAVSATQADTMLRMVHEFASLYPAAYPNIKLEYLDIVTNPSLAERFQSSATTPISANSVIVATDDDFRTFTLTSLFGFSEDNSKVLTFNAETKLTTAILQLAGDKAGALFTTGHGENTGREGARPALWTLFETAGYTVGTIDLTREEIPSGTQVLIINGPQTDFRGFGDPADEISKIGAFTDARGSLMLFFSPDNQKPMPELEAMLTEWGLKVDNALLKDYTNSESTDGTRLVAEYTSDQQGSSLTKTIRELDAPPKAIVEYARPVSVLWPDGERTTDSGSVRSASAILTTYPTAAAYPFDGSAPSDPGRFDLLAISRDMRVINNNYYYAYVLVCGTTKFASDDYLYKNAFSNGDVLYSVMRAMGKETVPMRLSYKWLEDNSLDITSGEANAWTIALTVVIPAVVLILGAVVAIRRKRL